LYISGIYLVATIFLLAVPLAPPERAAGHHH
jgi:hypothetical protein